MNKQQLFDIFSDESFLEQLRSAPTKDDVQKLLLENGSNVSADELIEFLLTYKGKPILSGRDMETVLSEGNLWSDIAVKYLDVEKQLIDTYGIDAYLDKTELSE